MGSGISVSSWPKTAQQIACFIRQLPERHKLRGGGSVPARLVRRNNCNRIQISKRIQAPIHNCLKSKPARTPRQKRIRAAVWILLLLFFAAGFFIVLRQREDVAKAPTGRRGAMGGAVAITTVTAQKGNIGVYVDAIGTVTPVSTFFHRQPGERDCDGGALHRGTTGAEGRSADRY